MEENLPQDGENTEVKSEQQQQVDPYVTKALEMGWRPQEEWTGDPEDFIEAKEFVRRQPLFDKINDQSKALKRLEQSFEALKTHHSKVKENEYQRALDTLKKAKRQAMMDGETAQALEIEDRIDDIQAQKREFDASLPPAPQEFTNPILEAWKSDNTWYLRDEAMTAYADKIGPKLAQQGLSPSEVLKRVTQEVRREFKHKFENPKREHSTSVEGGTRKTTAVTGGSIESQMPEEDRRIMNRIIRSGAMTKDEYLKQYKELS